MGWLQELLSELTKIKSMPKVVWELDVIGDEEKFETNDEVQLAVNQTLAEYLAEAQEVSFRLIAMVILILN